MSTVATLRSLKGLTNSPCDSFISKLALLGVFWILSTHLAVAQTNETIKAHSFIVNMGVTPQTDDNGLKPYGLLYDLLKNFKVPIKWVINPSKVKDNPSNPSAGVDFTYNGTSYKGGPFIIPAEYRTSQVNARITYWRGQGVKIDSTTTPITVPVYTTLYVVPQWTLDKQNGKIAVPFFQNAGIPATAHGGSSDANWVLPSALDCCDDLFVMPHADPEWGTHANLYNWNQTCKGSIWLGCHSGSALEDMFNPANPSQQTNFLTEKIATASGKGPYSENALVLWSNHSVGTLPYLYDYPTDPVMQFMGTLDVATQNGSEQIYIPLGAGWRNTTRVGVYDPNHPDLYSPYVDPKHRAGVVAWGPGLGDNVNRGLVMMEASHDISKSKDPASIAAQRAFFNFSFVALARKAVLPTITGITSPMIPGVAYTLTYTVPAPADTSDYDAVWASSCNGTFTPSKTRNQVIFTPSAVSGPTTCGISLTIKDMCGRETFTNVPITITCSLQATNTVTRPCFGGGSTGAINVNVTGATAPFVYNWTRTGGGSGSGTGATTAFSITGLSTGTYTVTLTSNNGAGCTTTFTSTIAELAQLSITATPVAVKCNGASNGQINVTVAGGTPAYTYDWADVTGTSNPQNRSGLPVGTYNLTVTDSKGCTATASPTITGPSTINITPTVANVNCRNQSTGSISLAVSGGTSPYTYLWNNGTTTQNRTNLAAGTYTVTVTDANGCTQSTSIQITQPAQALSLTSTQTPATCNGASNGSVTVTASGGTAPYSYDWSGTPAGDGTNNITGLSAGTYTVTVTDSKGCTAIRSTTVTQPAVIAISVVKTNPTCPPSSSAPLNSNGAINITVTGGTSPYTYAWSTSNGSGLVPGNEDQTGLTAGTYVVIVTDANGCTSATTSVTLNYLNPNPVQPGVIIKN